MSFGNLDLLSVGVATAGMFILGFVTFFNNRKSISNRIFLGFAIIASAWGIVNYASYHVASVTVSFWLLRSIMFFGVWASFLTFTLAYIFPSESATFPRYYKWALVPITACVALLSLTPLVFSSVVGVADGHVAEVVNGPGIALLSTFLIFLNIGGIVLLIRRVFSTTGPQRRAVQIFLLGFMFMLALILIFNFILPAFFGNTRFIPLGGLFLFPFVALTSYAVLRHHLLNVKVIATEILAFILAVVSLFEVVLSSDLAVIIFRSAVFVLVLAFSILLIRSVRKEVEQREELQRLNAKLDEANKKLEDLSHFKSELLSLASHQIRSPLAAMKGFLSLVLGGSYGPVDDKAKEALQKVQRSADELIGLINTLLDVRKVEEGKMEYQFARTDLTKIVSDVTGLLRPLAETKGLAFTFENPGKEIWVNADAEKLKQVVQNLVDNAIKYTPQGFVRVELKEEVGAATVTVADSGLGIAPALIPYLFEEFIRDERVKKEIRGTGLGLYIARRITEAHGGTIWAESAGEGKGSAFRLRVPEVG